MLVLTRYDGAIIPQVRDICDGCIDKPAEEHKCLGVVNGDTNLMFPKRQCNCNDCEK